MLRCVNLVVRLGPLTEIVIDPKKLRIPNWATEQTQLTRFVNKHVRFTETSQDKPSAHPRAPLACPSAVAGPQPLRP